MAVAETQIRELYEVITMHITPKKLEAMLQSLANTTTYTRNTSFKVTIDRLYWYTRDRL